MDAVKNTADGVSKSVESGMNYASDKAQELTSGTKAEANKEQAKDSNASIGDRASAAGSYISNKGDEKGHGLSATANKEDAKH